MEAVVGDESCFQGAGERADIDGLRIKPGERREDHVADGFAGRAAVDETRTGEEGLGCGDGDWREPPDLEVGAVGQIDFAVAMFPGGLGDGLQLGQRIGAAAGADAHEPAVTRLHGREGARAPSTNLGTNLFTDLATKLGGLSAHWAACAIKGERSLRRGCHRPRAMASSNRIRKASKAAGFCVRMKAATSALPR